MKFKFALATVMLSLAASSFAATTTTPSAQPEIKCPDIRELQAAQFIEASAVYDTNLWEVMQSSSQYGTQNAWNFKLNIEAEDKSSAMKLASSTLSTMKLIEGPERVDNNYMCHYRAGQHEAVAIMKLPTVPGESTAVAQAKTKAAKVVSKGDKLAAK